MSDRLSESELRKIAFACGLNEKGVRRLLGSQRIILKEDVSLEDLLREGEEASGGEERAFDIGLRISQPEVLIRILITVERKELLTELADLLREYARACPLVTAWAGRGDFKPYKLPERVQKSHVRHAAVTAGRLRARILRMAQVGAEPH